LILYVNGDSHTAGAEAVNHHCFAEDDELYRGLGRQPHPDNLYVSYATLLANSQGVLLDCAAESGASNERILRTTKEYLREKQKPLGILIGWSTWERVEYLYEGTYYQFSAGGVGRDWPPAVQDYYKQWVLNTDVNNKAVHWHNQIFDLHLELQDQKIPHLFFNTFSAFNHDTIDRRDWANSYIDPYNHDGTYYYWLKSQGFQTVNPNSYHFGPDAHRAWAEFLDPHLTNILNESIIVK